MRTRPKIDERETRERALGICFFTNLRFHSKHWEGNEKKDVGYFFWVGKGLVRCSIRERKQE